MSKPQSKIPSPARSLGAVTPRRHRTRRTLSVASPARSDASVRLSSIVDKFINNDKFTMSPMGRRSVLPDDTEIEAPRRASWWKRLEGSSRDVLEALDTNKMPDDLLLEEYEFEVEEDKQNQTAPESSDNESVASIVVPERRLFNQKKRSQAKFGEIMGSRKSLGRTNIEDVSIDNAPKNLFNKGPRNKPIFPAALLNSTNKTMNKTVEPETNKQTRPNLFGRAGTKRKNMFTDFVLSESEEDSEVHHKVFGFKNRRTSLGTRNRRMPSLTPSMTTEIDIDDWNLLPSSTMIGGPEVSRIITDKDIELAQEENQDKTLTEENLSLNPETNLSSKTKSIIHNKSLHQSKQNSIIQNEDNDKTLTNENIETEDPSKHQDVIHSKSAVIEDKTLRNKSSTRNKNDGEVIGNITVDRELDNIVTLRPLVEYEPSVEEAMAELHGEIMEKDISQPNSPSNTQNRGSNTNMRGKDKSGKIEIRPELQENQVADISVIDKSEEVIVPSTEEQEVEDSSEEPKREVTQENEDEDMKDVSEKDKSEEKIEPSVEEQEDEDSSKEITQENEDEDMEDVLEKDKSEEEIEPSVEEQEDEDSSKEVTQENEDEDMEDVSEKDKSEEKIEPSVEEQEDEDISKEVTQENEDEDMEDVSEKDKSEEEIEPSVEDQGDEEISKEASQEHLDEDIDDSSEKARENEQEIEDQESHNSSKEESHENQDDDMEEMVWDDNDDEKSSDHVETEEIGESGQEKSRKVSTASHASLSKNITNKSQKTGLSIREDQLEQENDVIEETPNNSTHDTTGQNRKKETSQVKSPEAVLQNITKDNESFRPIGRSTTFRKSKSVIFDNMNVRTSLPPVQESTLGSEGSRNSSTEGSEWDSHRTTRKTIRQTFGRGYTPRKSLRALVMEQSAKRQTELYNKTTANRTKNKSVVADVNDKNAPNLNKTKNKTIVDGLNEDVSKINKTKNKTVVDDVTKRDASKTNKTKNRTVTEETNAKNDATINKTKNKTVLEDVNDHHIRDRRVSKLNISSNQLSASKSPVHETFTHHVSDPLISEPEPEISKQLKSNLDASINISEQANNDSGPEISIHASYGQSMSAEYSELENLEVAPSDLVISDKENRSNIKISQHDASVPKKSMHVTSEQEVLDYEATDNEQSEEEMSEHEIEDEHSSQENADQDDSVQELSEQSVLEEEKEDSEPEESENQVEPEESENEGQIEDESQEEPESKQEESQQEIEAESEQEESQQEIEAESEQEESQQEIEAESEQEESQQEMEAEFEQEESQQEMEAESEQEESQQEMEAESEQESENEERDMSQESANVSQHESDQESIRDISEEPEQEVSSDEEENDHEDSDHFVSGLHSPHQLSNSNRTDRVVFDNEMSDQEIDYERSDRVSRQMTDNDISEQVSEREPSPEVTRSRISEHSRTHDVSVGTMKAMRLMQMEKIAQQNAEIRQKIREKVEKSLKTTRNFNQLSPINYKFSIRRMSKPEPKKPKPKTKPVGFGIPIEALPKQFVEDLKYRPPKRFSPANAPWITKRLYKFLETKLEPKYDYRARVRAEELVQTIYSFAKLVKRRRDVAPQAAVDELKREMARLHIVNTHFEFYDFFHEFMPREIRVKVNPDVVNKIPMPRNGIFGEILQSRAA